MNAPHRCAAYQHVQITHLLPLLGFVTPFATVLSRANNAAEVSAECEMAAI
jgi:hypothetical protein